MHQRIGGYLPSLRWRVRRSIPSQRAACETFPSQSVRTRWICSHSTRSREGVSGGTSLELLWMALERTVVRLCGGALDEPLPPQGGEDLFRVCRLGQVVAGSPSDCLHRSRDAAETGEHHDRPLGMLGMEFADQTEPMTVRKAQVDNGGIRSVLSPCHHGRSAAA